MPTSHFLHLSTIFSQHLQTLYRGKFSFMVAFKNLFTSCFSDSLQKPKWDHLWTQWWLLCSWIRSEGIFLALGNCFKMNSRPSSDLIIYQYINELLIFEWSLVSDGWFFFFVLQETSDRKNNSLLQVDQSSVRNSYSVFSLLRWELLYL